MAEALSVCLGSGGGGGDGTRVGMNRTEDSLEKGFFYVRIYIYRACLAGSKEFGVCFFGYFCSISVLLLASCKGGKELARQTSSRVEQSNTSSKPAESSSTFL